MTRLHVGTKQDIAYEIKYNNIYGVLSLCRTAVRREKKGLINEDSSDRKLDNVERSLEEFNLMLFLEALISLGLEEFQS